MDARWMPLLAAGVGVLGGVGGAFIGGYVANEGQERRLEGERLAPIHDLRVETYGTFLGTAEELAAAIDAESPAAEKQEAINRLLIAHARAALVSDSTEVRQAALDTTKALETWDNAQVADARDAAEKYRDAIANFFDLAQAEIEATEK